jgi:hypothetical protein
MVHMLDGMKGINLIMTYGGGTYDLHQFIPHQVLLELFVLLRKRCTPLAARSGRLHSSRFVVQAVF